MSKATAKKKPHGQTRALKNFAPKAPEKTKAEIDDERLQQIGRRAYSVIADMVARLRAVLKVSDCCEAEYTTITIEGVTATQCDLCGKTCETQDGDEPDEDAREQAQQEISEDPLSIQVRSGWVDPGEPMVAEEFTILLGTGGPAVRIIGELDRGEPTRARLETQDWGTPWTEYRGAWANGGEDVILTYACQFTYGDGS